VDFRELVKDLAAVFKTRIELRQIGVRDESKMMGGIGVCGRVLCCSSYLGEFQPVSIKMAKEQGLSLNPTKISGTCGRLMCCLKYEQDAYEQIIKRAPKIGAIVETPDGQGVVIETYLIKEVVKVKLDKGNETDLQVYKFDDIKVIKDVAVRDDGDNEIEALKALED
jgi:cell fate regulator YaaT (PSP1 superfamily)